jgi:hypothetical protein
MYKDSAPGNASGFLTGNDLNFQPDHTTVLQVSGERVELPDATFVRDADLSRDGMNLVLEAPDGSVVVIEGYFAAVPAPMLFAPDGSALTPALVHSFVAEPLQYADATGGATATDESPVGAVQEVSGTATVTHLDGTVETIQIGTKIFQGDIVETDAKGAVNIAFIDETTFAVSEDARLAIDEYVYDPSTQSGSTNFSVLKGVFVFTSGMIGREDPDDVQIETPVGSIGIRGTIIAGNVTSGEITVVEGAIVLKDLSGHEMTLANQFETARFNASTNQIDHMGQVAASQIVQNFSSIATVSPQLFSSINDSAKEAPAEKGNNAAQGTQQEQGGDGEKAQPNQETPNDNQTKDAQPDQRGDSGQAAPVQNAGAQGEPAQQQTQQTQQTQPIQTTQPASPPPAPVSAPNAGFGTNALTGSNSSGLGSSSNSGPSGTGSSGASGNAANGTGSHAAAGTTGAAGSNTGSATQPPPAQSQTQSSNHGTSTQSSAADQAPPPQVIQNQANQNNGTNTGANTTPPPATTPPANTPPTITSITGSHSIAENTTTPTVVAQVNAAGNDAGETVTYHLLGANAALFEISATGAISSKTGASFDFEGTPSYSFQVQVSDGRDVTTQTIVINVGDVNEAPTDLTLSNSSLAENNAVGDVIGTLTSTDPDAGETFTYTLVNNASGRFAISGSQLVANTVLDYEENASHSYDIVIRTTDADGLFTDKTVTINLTDDTTEVANNAPMGTNNSSLSTAEDTGFPFTVASFGFNDDSGDSLAAVRIDTAPVPANGVLRLSGVPVSNGDIINISDITDGKLTFEPSPDYHGTVTFNFSVQDNHGAFATSPSTMTMTITSVNDAPVMAAYTATLTAVMEDSTAPAGQTVASFLAGSTVTDIDGNPLTGIAITNVDNTKGVWQYWDSGDGSFVTITGLTSTNILLLSGSDLIRFLPNPDMDGAAGFTFRAWDQSSGTAQTYWDASGSTALSAQQNTATINITPDATTEWTGTSGPDTYAGTPGMDRIDGGDGDDDLSGDMGNDIIFGGAGNDIIKGGMGDDTLNGGENDDDFIIENGDGYDSIDGGAGSDTYNASFANTTVSIELQNSKVLLNGYTDTYTNIEIIKTGTANDIVIAKDGTDTVNFIDGGAGMDTYDATAVSSNPVTLDLSASTITIAGDINQIHDFERFILGSKANNTVTAMDELDTDIWLDGAAGSYDIFNGSGITNLVNFNVWNKTLADGSGHVYNLLSFEEINVNGGTLDFSATGSVALDIATGIVSNDGTGRSFSFSGFNKIVGSNTADSIGLAYDLNQSVNGGSGNDQFHIGVDSGNGENIAFSENDIMMTIQGGFGQDTLSFTDTNDGNDYVIDTTSGEDTISSIEIFDFFNNGANDIIRFVVDETMFNNLDGARTIKIQVGSQDELDLDFTSYDDNGFFAFNGQGYDGSYYYKEYKNFLTQDVIRVENNFSIPTNIHTKGVVQLDLGALNGIPVLGNIIRDSGSQHFGGSILAVGDQNHDGHDDLLIGRENDSSLFLFENPSASSLNSSGHQFPFPMLGAPLESMSYIGDFNGDGRADYALSFPDYVNGTNYGAVLIVDQKGDILYKITGEVNQEFGHTVVGAGDVNGDGYDDVLISAPGVTNGVKILYGNDQLKASVDTGPLAANVDAVATPGNGFIYVLQDNGRVIKYPVDSSGYIGLSSEANFSTALGINASTHAMAIDFNTTDGRGAILADNGRIQVFNSSLGSLSSYDAGLGAKDLFVAGGKVFVIRTDGYISVIDNIASSPTLAGNLNSYQGTAGVKFLGIVSGNAYLFNEGMGIIQKFNTGLAATALTGINQLVAVASGIPPVSDLEMAPDGSFYGLTGSPGNYQIYHYDTNGSLMGPPYTNSMLPFLSAPGIIVQDIAVNGTHLIIKTDNGTIYDVDIFTPSAPKVANVFKDPLFDDLHNSANHSIEMFFGGSGGDLIVLNQHAVSTVGNSYMEGYSSVGTAAPGGDIASAGDLDGDGRQDLAIINAAAGTIKIELGAHLGSGQITITGIDAGLDDDGQYEIPVFSLGDVNGDGRDDIAIAATGANGDKGFVHVVYGAQSLPGTSINLGTMASTQGFTLETDAAYGIIAGGAVGDFNGDGINDMAFAFKVPGFNERDVDIFVLYGSDNTDPNSAFYDGTVTLDELQDSDTAFHMIYTLPGGGNADDFDLEISAAGDANGDGLYDIAIGAPGADVNNGQVMVVYGQFEGGEPDVRGAGSPFSTLQGASIYGDIGNDTLNSGNSDQRLVGGQGNDFISQSAVGDSHLVMLGGAGNDTFAVNTTNFAQIDGGSNDTTGMDMIKFFGTSVDLTSYTGNQISRVEVLSMDGSTQTMKINLSTIVDLLNSSDNGNLIIQANSSSSSLKIDTNHTGDTQLTSGSGHTTNDVKLALEDVFGDNTVQYTHDQSGDGGQGVDHFTIGGHTLSIDSSLISTIVVGDVPPT